MANATDSTVTAVFCNGKPFRAYATRTLADNARKRCDAATLEAFDARVEAGHNEEADRAAYVRAHAFTIGAAPEGMKAEPLVDVEPEREGPARERWPVREPVDGPRAERWAGRPGEDLQHPRDAAGHFRAQDASSPTGAELDAARAADASSPAGIPASSRRSR